MRMGHLFRDADATGVSGTGRVAELAEFSDGVVAVRWLVPPGRQGSGWPTSVVFHDRGVESVEAVHGHNGMTRVVWIAEEEEEVPLPHALIDPDCRAGKHGSCVGGPCQCDCHLEGAST